MTQLALNKNTGIRRSPLSVALKGLLYVALIALALFTLIPFVWMLSASLKLDREVFSYPIRWIPEVF
ncbi:MAG: carbohydrate ABC transporter permease, partial [Clostridia bacterium]|nr:carbohydrate ABC transporter permease [Clostridia bacterium]